MYSGYRIYVFNYISIVNSKEKRSRMFINVGYLFVAVDCISGIL
jgi:hypothetical protein